MKRVKTPAGIMEGARSLPAKHYTMVFQKTYLRPDGSRMKIEPVFEIDSFEHVAFTLKAGEEFLSYEFISEGPKGLIHKRIQFTLVNRNHVFNLAFGDKDPVTGDINDLAVSNNNDSEKVLTTVIGAVYAFFDR